MENGRRCQGKRVEREEGKGRGGRRRKEDGKNVPWLRGPWLLGSLAPGLMVGGGFVAPGWLVAGWSCLVHIALRRLSFSLTILERCNTPYLARSKGGGWGEPV